MKRGSHSIPLVIAAILVPALVSAAVVTLPVARLDQHKDTTMLCLPGGDSTIHPNGDALNQCPHCGFYCAPASVAMYAQYRGLGGTAIQQDDIYDAGKFTQGETQNDGVIQTHGVGMFDGQTPGGLGGPEVQNAFLWSLGAITQYGINLSRPHMTGALVIANINDNIPILWCDHFGWPSEHTSPPEGDDAEVNGHAKIVAGYDDKGTADYSDDDYLIVDPWPAAATSTPYWVGSSVVLDVRDVYFTDYDVIPTRTSNWGEIRKLFR